HRHGGLHPPAAAPARRGLRRHARGDARRRSRPPRRRRVGVGRAAGRDGRGRERGPRRDRGQGAASRDRPEQGRRSRLAAPSPAGRAVTRGRSDEARAGERVIALPVVRLRDDAVVPARAYEHDAGLDLVACERVELGPGERATVPTGLAVAIPEGYAGFVQPRSGLAARHGITIVNTPGLVDSGYRGELKVILLNTDTSEPFVVEPGMRIAQLVVMQVPGIDPVEVDELPASE